ncbi:putative zinc-ribbon domain plant [Arabidopsis thaliana x Arabidopsis arenosa]|uniref:Putative zinc-ribbon domain plant n=1 Tax=Arabidopsis thaliana x Arabidopsis arenosa TaxID=1240361 RepID=A0A8T1ZNS8_9BRAS|nr:putative zinc-ribbon domain plant [Arabidopsis thaliana x Arabidopsis arenosa]
MMKKKKQSRSQSSSTKKSLEPSSDSSPSPRLLSLIRSKLASGKDLKHMFRGMRSRTVPGLSSQSRIVRCPKCHKLLQEPLDATSYKCGGCDSILHAKRWELEGNDHTNTTPEALLSSQNRSLSSEVESPEDGSRTPMRSTHREYNSRASPSVERGYHPETVYKHETSDIRREWMRRTDDFSETGDSDAFASARSSPYNTRSNASQWARHEGRYEDLPQVPFYPASPSPSSAYEYGYSSPFHGSHVSASEQSYYHHQPNQFKQYGREGWFQESSVASPTRFQGETSDGKYYHRSSQSQLHDLQYHNIYEPSSSVTPHHSVYSERNYVAAAAPHRSTYSEHSVGISKSGTSSAKNSLSNKKQYVRERNPVVKRHILPSAGGAPFATCSYCLELLHLPQVSPQGKRKRYQVRCGSCSGVLKFSIREKADTVLDSPSFVDYGMDFADENVTNHQDSASEGHEEIYPDGNHLPCLDDDFGDTICKSNDAVILSQSLETFEDKGIKEDMRNISSKLLDLKLEALQPHLKPVVNPRLREQQPASSETIGETSRIHLEQSKEAHSEKSTEMDNNNCERAWCDLEELEYEKNEIIKPEEIVGEGSGESLEVPVYQNERMSESSEEDERVAERSVSHSVKILYENEYVSETRVQSENTEDANESKWEETQENEEYGGESTLEEIGDKPQLHLEKYRYIQDSICDSSLSYGEPFEDTSVKEDTEHVSNTISDDNSLVNENQKFIRHPDQSGEATVTISSIQEQSKYEYESFSERQELEMTISDRVRYELEESRYETNETIEPSKVGEDGSVVSFAKASEAFETIIEGETGGETLVSHQMDSPNEKVENSYGTLEPIYLEESGFAGENTWEGTTEDRAALHLEEYESNFENYSRPFEWTSETTPTFGMHDYELGTILEPDEDADGRSESSSRGSFNDDVSSEERVIFHESQDAIPEQSHYEYESSSKRQELSDTVFDIVRSELQEYRYETNETLEPSKMVGDGSVVPVEKAGETFISEKDEESSVSHQMESQNEDMENSYGTIEPVYLEGSRYESENPWAETMGDEVGLKLEEYKSNPFEWTSESAPTFHLHEYEQWTVPEPEEDANGRSIPSSRDSFNDHESLKEIVVSHEEEPWLVDENKTEALKVGVMVEDGPSLPLTKCENELMKLEETLEWTSERAPTFRLHEYELGEMLESDNDVDERSDYSSRGSFNDHGISRERELFNEEEPQLVIDGRTEALQVGQMAKDTVSLHLEQCKDESMKLDETFEWTSGRTLTFRSHGYEVGTKLAPDEDADGRSESSSRGSFNDRGSSKESAVLHEDGPWLVDDYETKVLKVGVMAEDGSLLHLEKCENEKMELDETLEPRDDIFRLSLDDTLEQERMTFHLKMSQDKQENQRQTFKQGEAEKDIPAFGSRVSSEGQESPIKMAELDSDTEEEILGDHLEHLQKQNEKSGLTSEPHARIYSTTEPSEIVGLRHALYQTQNSPLRSPLTSPIHTPIGSPLHYLMASQIRSPIASPMHSHIVSPLRSPINSSGSLSDVLFFSKKT